MNLISNIIKKYMYHRTEVFTCSYLALQSELSSVQASGMLRTSGHPPHLHFYFAYGFLLHMIHSLV